MGPAKQGEETQDLKGSRSVSFYKATKPYPSPGSLQASAATKTMRENIETHKGLRCALGLSLSFFESFAASGWEHYDNEQCLRVGAGVLALLFAKRSHDTMHAQ